MTAPNELPTRPTPSGPPAVDRILSATDFSAPARRAMQRAAVLARSTGLPLALWHALPRAAPWQRLMNDGDALPERMRVEAETLLTALAGELAARAGGPVAHRVDDGPAHRALAQALAALPGALLVLGARGAGFVRRRVLGSTAERVLRLSPTPVLVVRQAAHEPYRRVLVGVDGSASGERLARLAAQLAPQVRLILVHAVSLPFEGKLWIAGVGEATVAEYRRRARAEALTLLHETARAAGLSDADWEPRVGDGDPADVLAEQEQLLDADLVVVGRHAQGLAESWLLGSTPQHLLAEGGADLLVVSV